MHIPDGFLDPVTATVTYAIFLTYLGFLLKTSSNMMTSEKSRLHTLMEHKLLETYHSMLMREK